MKVSNYVYLTGGLGNQLFQLFAALSISTDSRNSIVLDTVLGRPRKTQDMPDIFHLNIPNEIRVVSRKESVLSVKVAGYLLRMGIHPVGLERNQLVRKFMTFLGAIILSFRFRKLLRVHLADDVGFYRLVHGRSSVLLGYFQSYRYLQDLGVKNCSKFLEPLEKTSELLDLIANALAQKPIFVHVRLGDYLAEKQFGIPKTDYYRRALNKLDGKCRKIWIFSDDLRIAKSILPSEFNSNYFFVDDRNLSPAQILYLLRFGEDYVIANSSFSWWGAALSLNPACKVIAPDPWFTGMPEPKDLIPPHWYREKAYL